MSIDTRPVALQNAPHRLEFLVRREPFAGYAYGHDRPNGFLALRVLGDRTVTQPDETTGLALWLAHDSVNGLRFPPGPPAEESDTKTGQIVVEDFTLRRGAASIGFRQEAVWRAPDKTILLTETRQIRVIPSSSEGSLLDIVIRLRAEQEAVTLGQTENGFLCLRVAPALCDPTAGQMRNSKGDYGAAAMHGQPAAWFSAIGVVNRETVGLLLLDHPDNLGHPASWSVRADGLLSPNPFFARSVEMLAKDILLFRYRLLTHRGYVNAGWGDARLAEFAHEPPPPL